MDKSFGRGIACMSTITSPEDRKAVLELQRKERVVGRRQLRRQWRLLGTWPTLDGEWDGDN